MFHGRLWTPKQAQALWTPTRDLYLDGGRQFGKSFCGAGRFMMRLQYRIERAAELVRSGQMRPWAGFGKAPQIAAQEPPNVQAWVLAPRKKHLAQCRGYLRQYTNGPLSCFLHPNPRMHSREGGTEIWLTKGEVAARINFAVGSGWTAVTGWDIDLLWVEEAGLFQNMVWDAVQPLMWARDGELVATGTPSLGTEQWFSRGCLSGMDSDHPLYVPEIVERDPNVSTIVGSSYEAFVPNVRARAKIDAEKNGERWAAQWCEGDFRLPDLFVYNEWDQEQHVINYDPMRRELFGKRLPRPNHTYGLIDFSYGGAPGAVVVFHVWRWNPINRDRRQPLIIAVEDRQEKLPYTQDGWYQVMRELRDKHHIQLWYCDPSMPEMVTNCRKARIGPVKPADKGDKAGRINMVRSLLHHTADNPPAFYVTNNCRHLPRQFERYQYRTDREGNPTDVTKDYDDHALDCCAFLAGVIMPQGFAELPSMPA